MMHGYEPGTVSPLAPTGSTSPRIRPSRCSQWRSQESNVKFGLLAAQVVEDFLGLSYDDVLPTRSSLTACC